MEIPIFLHLYGECQTHCLSDAAVGSNVSQQRIYNPVSESQCCGRLCLPFRGTTGRNTQELIPSNWSERNSGFPLCVEKLCESCAWTPAYEHRMNPWEQIKQQLEAVLSAENYKTWVSRTLFDALENGVLRVLVPDDENKAWMETEYASHVSAFIWLLILTVTYISL